MRANGLAGAVRGRVKRTTIQGKDGVRAADLVNREFTAPAPNWVWVADFDQWESRLVPSIHRTPRPRARSVAIR